MLSVQSLRQPVAASTLDALRVSDTRSDAQAAARGGPPPTILVVEDVPSTRRILSAALAAGEFHLMFSRIAEAERIARETKPDIFLVDPGPPVGHGIRLIQSLRRWSSKRIIILTDEADECEKVAALDAGADDYLTRPVGIEELKARIRVASRRLNRSRQRQVPALFQIGNIDVNLSARRVSHLGKEIRLTPIEFRLLEALCAQPGKVMSHEALLESVWGASSVGKTHYLHIYIKHLRSKFKRATGDGEQHIETVACFGYRLIATRIRSGTV